MHDHLKHTTNLNKHVLEVCLMLRYLMLRYFIQIKKATTFLHNRKLQAFQSRPKIASKEYQDSDCILLELIINVVDVHAELCDVLIRRLTLTLAEMAHDWPNTVPIDDLTLSPDPVAESEHLPETPDLVLRGRQTLPDPLEVHVAEHELKALLLQLCRSLACDTRASSSSPHSFQTLPPTQHNSVLLHECSLCRHLLTSRNTINMDHKMSDASDSEILSASDDASMATYSPSQDARESTFTNGAHARKSTSGPAII